MKLNKRNYLIKGVYSHAQARGYLTVKQFIMLEHAGKHCLLLRFENEMKTTIEAVTFLVKQLDSKGKVLDIQRVDYSGLNIVAGQLYCPTQPIVIDEACADCVIQMKEIVSGAIKYRFRKGLVTSHYDPRGYNKYHGPAANRSQVAVRQKYAVGGKCYGWIAVLSLVLVIVAVGVRIGQSQDTYRSEEQAYESALCAEQESA